MIRVIDGDPHRLNALRPSKVVHVKVLEQKGNDAVIELNGLKMNAKMDQGLPPNFLAFVENIEGNFQLKVLSNVKNSESFLQLNREQLLEKIEAFFLENHLPFSSSLLKIALRFTEAGLRLDRNMLNLVHRLFLKHGEAFSSFLINLASRGIDLNQENIHFFYQWNKVLSVLLKKSQDLTESDKSRQEDESDTLIGFLGHLFGVKYDARLLGRDEQAPLVQIVKKEENGTQRFYIDVSGQDHFLLVIDWSKDSVDISVLLGKSLYDSIHNRIEENQPRLTGSLRKQYPERQVIVGFHVLERDIHLFELDNTAAKQGLASNLDIFV